LTERSPLLARTNLGLAVAIAIALLAGAIVLLGPGRISLSRTADALGERAAELEGWQHMRENFSAPSEHERAAWREVWDGLRDGLLPRASDPELVAHVSEVLQAGTVRRLTVERRSDTEEDEPQATTVTSPVDQSQLRIVPVRIDVSFYASVRDAEALLRRIEDRSLPARIESLQMRRVFPGVDVSLALTYFAREEASP
jgi:hypothetical protein